jgi:hypothetical protein
MAKKQKRQYSRSAAPVRTAETTAPATASSTPRMAPSSARSNSTVEFKPDYSYVIRDLKKIGIMAGSFIAILVILSFIIK